MSHLDTPQTPEEILQTFKLNMLNPEYGHDYVAEAVKLLDKYYRGDSGESSTVSEAQGDTPTPDNHNQMEPGFVHYVPDTQDNPVMSAICGCRYLAKRTEHSVSDSEMKPVPFKFAPPIMPSDAPSQSSTTADISWLDDILDPILADYRMSLSRPTFPTEDAAWKAEANNNHIDNCTQKAKLAITDSLRGNLQDSATPKALSNKADNLGEVV